MIVTCPACRTRYRYHEPVPETGAMAVCCRCEGRVPLVAQQRAYVLRAQVAAEPAGVPVGVAAGAGAGDGGTIPGSRGAPSAAETAAVAPPVEFGAVAAEVDPSGSPFDNPVEVSAISIAPKEPLAPEAQPSSVSAADAAEPLEAAPERSAESHAAEGSGGTASRGAGALRRVLQLLAIVVLGAAGAAAGEYATMEGWLGPVEVHSAIEPVRLGIVGGLLGVLVAWAVIRWTTRRS